MKGDVFVVPVQSRGVRLRCAGAVMAVCVISFGMTAGCGGRAADGTVAVTGTVLIDGGPLALRDGDGGGINFQSIDGTYSANARIGVNGAYATRLRPGAYEVAVWAETAHVVGESGQMPRAESLLSKKYSSTRTSGIQVEVPLDGGTVNVVIGK